MENKKKLKGVSLNIAKMNMAIYGQSDPDMPNLPPEELRRLYNKLKPRIDRPIGKAIIMGTGGSIDKGSNFFYELWDLKKSK